MQSAFSACLMVAAVSAATAVTTDEYKYSKKNPMGASTSSSSPPGFGEAFAQMDFNASLVQMDDNTVVITKTIELTMKDTWQPNSLGASTYTGEVYVCDKDGTDYECVVGTWTNDKLTLQKRKVSTKPTTNAYGNKTAAALSGDSNIEPFFPLAAGTDDCIKIQDYTFADSTAGTAATTPAACTYWTAKDITWTTPSFKFSFTRTVTAADAAAAKKVLTDYADTAKTINSGISFENGTKRERIVFDEEAAAVAKKVDPAPIDGADVVTSAMAIALTAAAALF